VLVHVALCGAITELAQQLLDAVLVHAACGQVEAKDGSTQAGRQAGSACVDR
jgi:hypothetical protein